MRTRAPARILIETSISEVAELQTEDLVGGNAITRRESLSSALPVLRCGWKRIGGWPSAQGATRSCVSSESAHAVDMVAEDFTCRVIDPHGQPSTDRWRANSPDK